MAPGPDLDAAQLLETAATRTGLSDFGPPTFREGLDRIVEGIRTESQLNPMGQAAAPEVLLSYLVNRLQVLDWQHRYPEITEAPVVPPVVMIGMGRTGTTILHDLLGQDPATRVPLTWETEQPSPPPETATYETDPRIPRSRPASTRVISSTPSSRRCTRPGRSSRRSASASPAASSRARSSSASSRCRATSTG